MADDYLVRIGKLIRDARQHRGWTQAQLAEALGTSQSAVNRIERGNQNISLEMIARIGEALESEIVFGLRGADASAGGRRSSAVRRHRRQDEQERVCRAALRLPAQQGPHGAAPG